MATLGSSNILLSHHATPICVNKCYVCPAIFIMFEVSDFHEQRICVKCCVKLGKYFMEMFEMLKTAFGDEALGRTQTYDWWKHFKDGETSTDDDPWSGRHSVSKIDEIVAKVIHYNLRLTVTR
jgi:hypothetical protein